jgi:hypothetical protein
VIFLKRIVGYTFYIGIKIRPLEMECLGIASRVVQATSHQRTINCKNKKAAFRQLSFVENIGVEPMTSCMPCKRSSQLS